MYDTSRLCDASSEGTLTYRMEGGGMCVDASEAK